MRKAKPLSRRRFLLMGGGTALASLLPVAYLISDCPLSDSGVCVGPCAAFIDRNGDGICDRVQRSLVLTQDQLSSTQEETGVAQQGDCASCSECPFGLVDDPYPGQCARYVDRDGNGLCDLSESEDESPELSESAPEVQPTPTQSVAQHAVACPFGLVNDPSPGKCRRYVDRNGNGICDLSEVESDDSEPPVPTPADEPTASAPQEGLTTPTSAAQGVACPFGWMNDPYPGQCRRYVDRNGNGFCDLSELGSGENEAKEVESGGSSQRRGRGGGR